MHAMQWIGMHWVGLLELVAIGAIALAIVMGADAYGRHRADNAAVALYEATNIAPGSEESLNALKNVAKKYSRTGAGRQAIMKVGDALAASGDRDAAIEQFRLLAERSRNQPLFRIAALHRIADIELLAGNYTAAAESFRRAAADPKNLLSLTSELFAAVCLERAKDFAKAAELYKRIIQDAGESDRAARDTSEERLLWLYANGHVSI